LSIDTSTTLSINPEQTPSLRSGKVEGLIFNACLQADLMKKKDQRIKYESFLRSISGWVEKYMD
jgi:hypothetical protein